MTNIADARAIAERARVAPDRFHDEVFARYEPVVLRGQVADWPAVAAGRDGCDAMAAHIAAFDSGNLVELMIGQPAIAGRFFYDDDVRGFNFKRQKVPVAALLAELLRLAEVANPPALYAGAAAAAEHLPGWTDVNATDLPLEGATPRVWIGNATRVSTHFDGSPNLACVVAGKRRFLLFPPDQIANLYVGPLENTLAGQPVSMVDPDAPDLDRYPRFSEAMRHALVAELEPGDAIFIPSLWWHNVRSEGPLNVLVNYWWDSDPQASPFVALGHALLAIRDLSAPERRVWRQWFDHYAFSDDAPTVVDHLPAHARGILGPPSQGRSDRLKGFLRSVFAPR